MINLPTPEGFIEDARLHYPQNYQTIDGKMAINDVIALMRNYSNVVAKLVQEEQIKTCVQNVKLRITAKATPNNPLLYSEMEKMEVDKRSILNCERVIK